MGYNCDGGVDPLRLRLPEVFLTVNCVGLVTWSAEAKVRNLVMNWKLPEHMAREADDWVGLFDRNVSTVKVLHRT